MSKDWDLISVEIAEPVLGVQVGRGILKTHGPSQCEGQICCIHNPTNHHMRTWPQNWRGDKGMMERICEHGVGHPDPDDLAVRTTTWAGVHGCCQGWCCSDPEPDTGHGETRTTIL